MCIEIERSTQELVRDRERVEEQRPGMVEAVARVGPTHTPRLNTSRVCISKIAQSTVGVYESPTQNQR